MQRKVNILFFLVFLFQVSVSFSQKPEFEHLSDKDGLVNSSITSIVKDSYGYMWFGTWSGLCRYDGYSFTNYVNVSKDKNSLPDNQVKCLFESKDITLFIGHYYSGISIFDKETETFSRLVHNPKDSTSLSHNYILTFFGDKKGNIWVGTKGGLDKYNPKTKTFSHFAPVKNIPFFVAAMCEDDQGNLWLYCVEHKIYKFNP